MMKVRPDVVKLLHAGYSDVEIGRRAHVCPRTAAAARRALGLPVHKGGRAAASSPEVLFRAHTRRVKGGHLKWVGTTSAKGFESFRWKGRVHGAHRVAFVIQYGRPPVGRVRPGCGRPGCIAPGHLEDRLVREQLRAQMASIFPAAPRTS